MNGKWLLIEGGENCGKTTQVQKLEEWFPTSPLAQQFTGLTVTREPGGTYLGRTIRYQLLLNMKFKRDMCAKAELLLFAADRAQNMDEVVRPALERGELVIQDRGFLSTIAYQAFGRGLSHNDVTMLNYLATDNLDPDLTIWIDVPPNAAMQRGDDKLDRIESEGDEFHQRVYDAFSECYRRASLNQLPMVRIDGMKGEDEVFGEIVGVLNERL